MSQAKYHIKPKRDFGSGPGFYIRGEYVKKGFVVTDGFCNVMPGATWFRSIPDALYAIGCLESTKTSEAFWKLLATRDAA